MERVFLSYRRGDAADVVGRIDDRLKQRYGPEYVFRDVDDIKPAANFRKAIAEALRGVACILVVIGPDWLDARSSDGTRRLDQNDDAVRTEIESARTEEVPILPILVRGAEMPPRTALPESISWLSDVNGIQVRPDPDFDGDMDRLAAAIDEITGTSSNGSAMRKRLLQISGIAVVLALIIALGVFAFRAPVVPSLVGLNEVQASDILQAAGIGVHVRAEQSEIEQGLVVSQDPSPGDRARDVSLVISEGQRSVVPELIGKALSEVEEEISDIFVLEIVRQPSEQSAGLIVDQFPDAGTESETVLIFVSEGPTVELPTIPQLVGLTETEATAAIPEGVELDIDHVEHSQAEGTVLAQDPEPGARASAVSLTVSAGPGLPVIPDLEGLTEADATAQLDALGIAITSLERLSSMQMAGVVIGQNPASGERSEGVALTVSQGPAADIFVGTWLNVDEATRGMTRLVIEVTGPEDATINGFGQCTPQDCDWGVVSATVVDGVLSGRYDFGWKTTDVTAELADDLLVVTTFDDYAEGDSRSDRTSQYVMATDPSLVTTEVVTDAIEVRPDLDVILIAPDLLRLVPTEDAIELP
jgi:beta-lactam-binding protein with PASTA domain